MANFDRVALLERLLEQTWTAIASVEPDKQASLIKEARFIGAELAELKGEAGGSTVKESPLDELRRRREDRKRGRA